MRLDHLNIQVTAEDMEAARLMGATGPELMEAAIHTALDRMGEPRTGRTVTLKPGGFYVDMEEE
jgi:hypothetical protein